MSIGKLGDKLAYPVEPDDARRSTNQYGLSCKVPFDSRRGAACYCLQMVLTSSITFSAPLQKLY
jgi:hypothetical protein